MAGLRAELTLIVERLLAASEHTGAVALDDVGEALGTTFVTTDEIDRLLEALERRGRVVTAPEGPGATSHLRAVVGAVRELKRRSDARPTLLAVAEQAELTREQVLVALALLRVMQR